MENDENTYLKYNMVAYFFSIIVFPVTCCLFYNETKDIKSTVLIVGLPVLVCYVIPFIGVNITKLWKFKAKFRIGNMPLYHGFSFGACINLFGLIMYTISPLYKSWTDTLIFCFVLASLITFWNLIVDVQAVKDSYIEIYNKAYFEHKPSYEVVCDYAIPYFFSFGFIYALFIKLIQYFQTGQFNLIFTVFVYIMAFVLPSVIYSVFSYIKNGNFGIFPYKKEKP